MSDRPSVLAPPFRDVTVGDLLTRLARSLPDREALVYGDGPRFTFATLQQEARTIARGLMAHPRLLLLDEPTLGLAPLACRQVFDLLGRLNAGGLAVLLAEQDVRNACGGASEVLILGIHQYPFAFDFASFRIVRLVHFLILRFFSY